MWCRNCQQEVPGVAGANEQRSVCCVRCGAVLAGSSAGAGTTNNELPLGESVFGSKAALAAGQNRPPLPVADWEFDDQLLAAERMAKRFHAGPRAEEMRQAVVPAPHVRFDRPAWAARTQLPARATKPGRQQRFLGKPSLVAWSVLSLGLMTFACGAVLLVWSFVASRHDLWSLGLPLTLVGQAALVIGLVLQLDSLWQSSRETTHTLLELDEQLHNLRHTTTLLGSTHGSAAQSFYAHMAEGARPELLMADLKGQLDLLAQQLARERQ